VQLTLQVTTGPHAGRKVLLKSGQIARIGRTEWADFSFPQDAELADVHFAVQCQLQGAKVRKLAADKSLAVNAKEVTEVELKPGDAIQAGKTAFLVAFDGQVLPASPIAAAAAVSAAATTATSAAGPAAKEPTALEVAEQLQLGDEELAVAAKVKTGPDLVAALAAKGAFAKAVRVQAHLLPKRHAVWWGHLCVTDACAGALTVPEAAAQEAAHAWVKDPSEPNRRQCEFAAAKTKYDGPGSWLAMAAFWNGGSLAPPEQPEVPPDDKLTGQGVTSSLMIAAVTGDPTKAKDRYRAFLAKAPAVASGKIPLPEKK
jgi:hypothetical protein